MKNNEILEKILEAVIFCMDYPLSQIIDDEEYSDKIDFQNELKEMLSELQKDNRGEKEHYDRDDAENYDP